MQKYLLILVFIIFNSCTEDRIITSDIIVNPNLKLILYCNFNDVSNLTKPIVTKGGTSINYSGAYYDEVEGSELNLKLNSIAGNGLRLRNPAGDLIIAMPTLGYKDIVLTYAVMRTGSGAQTQNITYTTDGINYTSAGLNTSEIAITEVFAIKQFNFT
jgi:hypothetical protein